MQPFHMADYHVGNTMTPEQRSEIDNAVIALETASVEMAFSGYQDQCNRLQILGRLHSARKHLKGLLDKQTEGLGL